MKKSLFLILFVLALAACSNKPTTTLTVITSPSTEPSTNTDSSVSKKVSECENNQEILDTYLNNKLNLEYETDEIGKTTATKLFINYVQNSNNKTIQTKNGCYYYSDTHSTFVNRTHIAYFNGEQVSLKDKSEDYEDISLETYVNTYGVNPFSRNLFGMIISEETILNLEKEEIEGGFRLTIDLDVETATNNCKIQMKEFGDLNDYPVFASVRLTVEMDDSFTPIKETSYSEYTVNAPVLGTTSCVQELTKTYIVGENITIPSK